MQDTFATLDADAARQHAAQVQVQQASAQSGGAAQLATKLAAAQQKYGSYLSPAIIHGLITKLGLDPADPAFDQVAQVAAKSQQGSGIGSWVERGVKDSLSVAGTAGGAAVNAANTATGGLLKPAVRTALLAAGSGVQEAEGAFRNVAAWKPGGLPVGAAVAGAVAGAGVIAAAPEAAVAAIGTLGTAAVIGGATALGTLGGAKIRGQGHWEFQSAGAIAAERALKGQDVQLGHGFLPNSDAGDPTVSKLDGFTLQETKPSDAAAALAAKTISAEQTRRADRVTIAGHAVTPGRLLAAGVLQPGSKPYSVLSGLVDADLNWHYDPAQLVGARVGDYVQNQKLFVKGAEAMSPQGAIDFVKAGGLFSARPTIDAAKGGAWLDGASGLKQNLADNSSFFDIWDRTHGKLGFDVTDALSKASTPEEVDAVLRPEIGVNNGLRGPVDFKTHTPWAPRILQDMPPHAIPASGDPEAAIAGLTDWMRNANLPREEIEKHVNAMAAAQFGGERHAVVAAAADAVKSKLLAEGWSEQKATALTRMNTDVTEEMRMYGISDVSNDWNPPGMQIADDGVTGVPNPHLLTEYQLKAINLPEARDIRSATSMFAPLLKNDGVWATSKLGTSAIDFLQGQIWKPLITIRGALGVRTIADEQARMAASGLDSMFHNPLSAIAYTVSPDSWKGRMLDKLGLDVGKGGVDVFGNAFHRNDIGEGFADDMKDFTSVMTTRRDQGGLMDAKSRWVGRGAFYKGNPKYVDAWAGEVNRVASDPVARAVAGSMGDLGAVQESFKTGELSKYREQLMRVPSAEGLKFPEVADAYVQSLADRVHYASQGDGSIVDAIAHGTLNGEPLRSGMGNSRQLVNHLTDRLDIAPPRLAGDLTIGERGGAAAMARFHATTDFLFSHLVGEPSNILSRASGSKQLYWQRVEELAPSMDSATRAEVVDAARKAKLGDVADRIAAAKSTVGDTSKLNADLADLVAQKNDALRAATATPELDTKIADTRTAIAAAGGIDLANVNVIANGFAADQTKALFHDLGHKSQFGDQLRLVSPFAEAWRQMITKYAKIGIENPEAVRKVDQVIEGARGSGFFHKDANGQEVFSYPGSGWISNKLIGVPIPLTGKTSGLTLATEVLPGVGPVVSMAAGAFLPDQPNWDWARKALLPYGAPDTSHGVLEGLLPGWATRLKDAGFTPLAQNQAAFMSTVSDTARYLASTGKYDTGNVDDMTRLYNDARQKAKYVFLLRSAAQFVSPAAPQVNPQVEVHPTVDDKGQPLKPGDASANAIHLATVDVLVKEYHSLLDDPKTRDSATETMLSRYGDGISLILQGKSTASVPDLPGSQEGAAWQAAHKDVVSALPNVWGFFAPQGGTLDLTAYSRQVNDGERQRLTVPQQLREANNRVANTIFYNTKDALGAKPTAEQTAALAALKAQLVEKYPGFGDTNGIADKASTATLVTDLERAAKDKRLASNPTTHVLQAYLAIRQESLDQLKAGGLAGTSFKNKSADRTVAPLLRTLGAAFSQKDPGFAAMWDTVFSKELNDVVTPG